MNVLFITNIEKDKYNQFKTKYKYRYFYIIFGFSDIYLGLSSSVCIYAWNLILFTVVYGMYKQMPIKSH